MTNLQLVPEPAAPQPAEDHAAIEEFITEMRQSHQREMRVLQNRINTLVQENTELRGQIVEQSHALDVAEAALLSMEVNNDG